MLRTIHQIIGKLVIARLIEHSQKNPCREKPHRRLADQILGKIPFAIGLHDILIDASAVEIASGVKRLHYRLLGGRRHFMVLMDVQKGPAVGYKVALKAPFSTENFLHQIGMRTARIPVCPVIGAHDGLHTGLPDTCFELGQIGLPQILFRAHRVERVTNGFGSRMYRKMFRARGHQHIAVIFRPEILRVFKAVHIRNLSLKPRDKCLGEHRDQFRIFAVRWAS